jgi:PIN domain nuclease of toxin-antitoxin system
MHLIDTNAWKWLAAGRPLKPAARVLGRPDHSLFLLDISFWEICKAVEYGTLILTLPPLEWILRALTANITVLTITPELAARSCQLAAAALPTSDPADQLIVAAALEKGLTLATRDRQIITWGGVPVLEY